MPSQAAASGGSTIADVHKPGCCRLSCHRTCLAVVLLGLCALTSIVGLSVNRLSHAPGRDVTPLGGVAIGAIPNTLVFTYPYDVLNRETRSAMEDTIASNVRRTVSKYSHGAGDPPAPTVLMYDDERCEGVIRRVASDTLAEYYKATAIVANKRDLCRVAALYEVGGFSFAPDVHARFDVRRILASCVEFSAVLSSTRPVAKSWYSHILPAAFTRSTGSSHSTDESSSDRARRFVPSFVAAVRGHPVLKTYLEYMEDLAHSDDNHSYVPDMGSSLLYKAFSAWSQENPSNAAHKTKLFREGWLDTWHQTGSVPGGMLRHVERQSGSGCCCNAVVYDPESYNVPFYSHTVGSQACSKPKSKLRLGKSLGS